MTRAMAITVPGMFLSHPGSETLASYHCADMTVSIESAVAVEGEAAAAMVWEAVSESRAAGTRSVSTLQLHRRADVQHAADPR